MTFVTVVRRVPKPITGMIGVLDDREFERFEANLDWLVILRGDERLLSAEEVDVVEEQARFDSRDVEAGSSRPPRAAVSTPTAA